MEKTKKNDNVNKKLEQSAKIKEVCYAIITTLLIGEIKHKINTHRKEIKKVKM